MRSGGRQAIQQFRAWRHNLVQSLKTALRLEPAQGRSSSSTESGRDSSSGLLELQAQQHRIIMETFRVMMVALAAMGLGLLGFTVYILTDPRIPIWFSLGLGLGGLLLLVAGGQTWRESVHYKRLFDEVQGLLQRRVVEHSRGSRARGTSQEAKGGYQPVERLLLSMKPSEHRGWDAKECQKCGAAIELLSKRCPHCGKKQKQAFVN